jgi:hypothetical protein
MHRSRLARLILAIAFCCSPLFAEDPPPQAPADLNIELRSATGANHFQLGEVIPLEVFISSSTPNRYLEPCKMFWESCFGYPQCRFESPSISWGRWPVFQTPRILSDMALSGPRQEACRNCPICQAPIALQQTVLTMWVR